MRQMHNSNFFSVAKIVKDDGQGPVVQSIVSLTTSLRGQLVILIFFVEKIIEAFAVQKLLTLYQQNILAYIRY